MVEKATVQSGPSYANEQKVDHFNVALEVRDDHNSL